MRNLLYAFCIGSVLWMSLSLALQATDDARTVVQVGSILGTVTDEQGQPLAGIQVNAKRVGPLPASAQVTTDATGAYVLIGIEPGEYEIRFVDLAWPRRYTSEYFTNTTHADQATPVRLTDGALVAGVDAQLAPTGNITGVIVDEHGKPLTSYISLATRDQAGNWQNPDVHTNIDTNGVYTLTGIDAGTYRVGFFSAIMPQDIPLYYEQYFPRVTRIEEGADVEVEAGKTTGGINARLVAKGKISGKVTDAGGHPVGGIFLEILWLSPEFAGWRSPRWYNPKYTPTTDATGYFELPGLDAGAYRIGFRDWISPGFQLEYFDNVTTFELAQTLVITKDEVLTAINEHLNGPSSGISGKITDQAGNPLAGIVVSNAGGRSTTSNAAGEYAITALPSGDYLVQFLDGAKVPERRTWASQYYNQATGTGSAVLVPVHTGQVTTGINARLAPLGRIMGRVTDLAGNPLPQIRVAIYQPFAASWAPFTGVTTDANGLFSLALDDGDYRVGFYDLASTQQYVGAYYPNVATLETAATITLRAGVTTTTDARLIPMASLSERMFLPRIED